MKNFKNVLSCFMCFIIVFALIGGVYADDLEKTYNVTYKECNLYRSIVLFEKDYETKYVNSKCIAGYEFYKTKVSIDGVNYDAGMKPVTLDKLANYEIVISNEKNGYVFKTQVGMLHKNNNKITVEFENLLKVKCIYEFEITVDVVDSDRIDMKNFKWIKVDKPLLKWVNELKFGSAFNPNKKEIILNETVEYTTTKNVFGLGKTFFYVKNKPSNLVYTKNQKLDIGDNTLTTKLIKYESKKVKCWFKVEYIVNLVEKVDTSTSPSTSPTATVSTSPDPTTTTTTTNDGVTTNTVTSDTTDNTVYSGLPKTGESEDKARLYTFIGIIFICAAICGIVVIKRKYAKNH